ncbi:MAG: hypothetical protein HOW73_23865 [Polyangiaceae bacterium]|nr:hypothetical protein [Polyangiaceae bacterium]
MVTRSCLVALVLLVGCGDDGTGGAGGSGGSPPTSGGGGEGGISEGGAAPTDLTVLAWNLEQFPKTDETISLVEQILDEVRPDVVGLEEIGEEADWQTLVGALDDYEGVLAMSGDGFSRVAMLYRPDRVQVSDAKMAFADDSYAFPRPMLTVHVQLNDAPEENFLYGVVHLKAQLDQESEDRRRSACIKLDQWINEQQQAGVEDEIVVTGDFNDELTDPQQWNVFGPLLQSADGGFLTLAPEQAGEFTYIPFESFIDHVLVRGGDLFQRSGAEVVKLDEDFASYESLVSDHRPVLATIVFPPR